MSLGKSDPIFRIFFRRKHAQTGSTSDTSKHTNVASVADLDHLESYVVLAKCLEIASDRSSKMDRKLAWRISLLYSLYKNNKNQAQRGINFFDAPAHRSDAAVVSRSASDKFTATR